MRRRKSQSLNAVASNTGFRSRVPSGTVNATTKYGRAIVRDVLLVREFGSQACAGPRYAGIARPCRTSACSAPRVRPAIFLDRPFAYQTWCASTHTAGLQFPRNLSPVSPSIMACG